MAHDPDTAEAGSPVPTKVCRYCSVQSTTASEDCPACGRPYARHGWSASRAALLVVPAAAAVAAAAGGYALLSSGDDSAKTAQPPPRAAVARPEANVITLGQARAIPLGSPRRVVLSRLGPPKPVGAQGPDPTQPKGLECVYYNFAGTPDGDFRLCFERGRLARITTVYT